MIVLKDLLEKRQKGIQEQIRDWKDSLPSTEALLLEFTAMYLARHPQPTAVFKELNKITCACHRQYEDKFKYYCASIKANHEVPYYDSGDFDWLCDECKAKLLRSEKDAQNEHKWGKCCAYGDVNTTLMKEEFAELTTNAPENLQNILYREKSERENFFNNTLPLNNAHSFGSIECGKVILHINSIFHKTFSNFHCRRLKLQKAKMFAKSTVKFRSELAIYMHRILKPRCSAKCML